MKITCHNCQKSYNIPDDKLPQGKKVVFPCPKCKSQIDLDLRDTPDAGQDAAAAAQAEPDAQDQEGLKKRVLKRLDELPPMPQIVFKAHEIIDDPNSNTSELSDLIETDQAIATRVLKMANSAYYGMSGQVSSIQHASVVLGYKSLGELITLAGASSLLSNKMFGYNMDPGFLWTHAMFVGFASKTIASAKDKELENDAFSAGLIHDVGKLLLDRPIVNRKKLFEEYMESGDRTFLSAERKILGFDHAEMGFEICTFWKIPESLGTAIRFHHDPSESSGDLLSYIVYMANTIANMYESLSMVGEIESSLEGVMYMLDDSAMEFLDLDEQKIREIMFESKVSVEKISQDMNPAA